MYKFLKRENTCFFLDICGKADIIETCELQEGTDIFLFLRSM